MIILGIDPGLGTTGYAVLEYERHKLRLLEAGVIRGRSKRTLPARIHEIYIGITEIISEYKPEALSLEELYSYYKRPKTAILMGHARGGIMLAAANAGIPVVSYSATRIKKILTGSGRATKAQMQRAVQTEFHLTQPPSPPDVADAMAIALCHAFLGSKNI